jgi:S-adenosyl-L-methionine hydrolase (adenosine-forming)
VAAGILTLTTDFGTDGPYVASIKGVVLGLAPGTQIVDASHAIAPQDIVEGSFVLAAIVDFFPPGTVHLAVVDPGVGTDRRVIAVEVQGHRFVLPDNGLIGGVLRGRDPSGVWEIKNPAFRRANVSATFHGRDIMAPAAAHLLNGGDPGDLGPPLDDLVLPSAIEPTEDAEGLVGEVVFRDSFGNLITNIPRDRLGSSPPSSWEIEILDKRIDGLVWTYGEQPPGTIIALIGSSDRVEIAVVNGNAARSLQAGRGTPIVLRRKWETPA